MPDAPVKLDSTKRKVIAFLEGPILPVATVTLAIAWFWGLILPFILSMLIDTVHFVGLVLCLGLLFYMLADPRFRMFFFYLYRSAMRFVMGQFTELDPIGIMKTYKERAQENLESMDKSLGELNGQKFTLSRVIDSNNSEIKTALGLVEAAGKKNDDRTQFKQGKQAGRLTDENADLNKELNNVTLLVAMLNRYREASSDFIEDIGNEIKSRERKRKLTQSTKRAVNAAMGILKGIPGEKDLYDDSIEVVQNQYDAAIGDMENMLTLTRDVISTADLKDSASVQRALQMIEQKNSGVLFKQIPAAPDVALELPRSAYQPATVHPTDDDYQKFFRGDK